MKRVSGNIDRELAARRGHPQQHDRRQHQGDRRRRRSQLHAAQERGVRAMIMSPVYSDYEDSRSAATSRSAAEVVLARAGAGQGCTAASAFTTTRWPTPTRSRSIANHIGDEPVLPGQQHPCGPPATQPVWDSGDVEPMGSIYPRAPEPNTVDGTRSGQCVLARRPTTRAVLPAQARSRLDGKLLLRAGCPGQQRPSWVRRSNRGSGR